VLVTLLFGMPSLVELIVILVVVLLVFGSRIPNVMRNLGKSVSSFKKGLEEGKEEDDKPSGPRA
jgi:sec-independent protein translocase protein TatA